MLYEWAASSHVSFSLPAILFVQQLRPPVNAAAGLASFLLCFYWFQPDTETDRKKGPFQEEVKWSSSGWRVAFTTLLTRWKNVTIMEALAADSELIGWVPPGQSGARSPCSQTRANKRAEESAWTGGEVSLYQASLQATFLWVYKAKSLESGLRADLWWTSSLWTLLSKHSGFATFYSSRDFHVLYVTQEDTHRCWTCTDVANYCSYSLIAAVHKEGGRWSDEKCRDVETCHCRCSHFKDANKMADLNMTCCMSGVNPHVGPQMNLRCDMDMERCKLLILCTWGSLYQETTGRCHRFAPEVRGTEFVNVT